MSEPIFAPAPVTAGRTQRFIDWMLALTAAPEDGDAPEPDAPTGPRPRKLADVAEADRAEDEAKAARVQKASALLEGLSGTQLLELAEIVVLIPDGCTREDVPTHVIREAIAPFAVESSGLLAELVVYAPS